MLRVIFAIVCLASLSACGLKGPLFLPERQAPIEEASPVDAQNQTDNLTDTTAVANEQH